MAKVDGMGELAARGPHRRRVRNLPGKDLYFIVGVLVQSVRHSLTYLLDWRDIAFSVSTSLNTPVDGLGK